MNFTWKNWRFTKRRSMLQKVSTDLHNNSPAKTAATWSVTCEGVSFHFAQYRRGNGRWHSKDRKNFFWSVRGAILSAFRVELCRRQKLMSDLAGTQAEWEVLSKVLTALTKGMLDQRT
jgi:hypothetical protein